MQNEFSNLSQPLSSTLHLLGQTYLYFGGTAYLGIPQNKEFIKLYIDGIERFGLNNGTSRGNNVQLGIYTEAELFAANKFGAEAALITSSGYLAAQLTVAAHIKDKWVRYAPDTHPALWHHDKPLQHQSFKDWAASVVKEINQSSQEHWLLLSNSVNNLFPEIYDFSFIDQISIKKKVTLIVDDSHGIGLLNGGKGVLPNIPKNNKVEVIVVASMAKALGVDAGLVLGSNQTIGQLKQGNVFYGASPPAAAALFAFMQADQIYSSAYEKLKENVNLLLSHIHQNQNWTYTPHFPVFLSKETDIDTRLMQEKILISSFPYPDKDGLPLNRVVLSSWHSKADVLQLAEALGK